MAFDNAKWNKTAVQGDLAAVAFATKASLDYIIMALSKLRDGESINEQLQEIQKKSDWLEDIADNLTGYTANDD